MCSGHSYVQILRNGCALLPHELDALSKQLHDDVGYQASMRAAMELAEACRHNMACKQIANLNPTWSDEQIYRGMWVAPFSFCGHHATWVDEQIERS